MFGSSRVNFVLQQGVRDASPSGCDLRYPALMFQPRVIGVLFLVAVVLQSWWLFGLLGVVLAWCAVLPRLNPFDAIHDRLFAGRDGRPRLEPAPSPRRFAQGLAGTLMLGVAAALLTGRSAWAWGMVGFLAVAIGALVFGRFCLGSFLYHVLVGDGAFARRTLPWA